MLEICGLSRRYGDFVAVDNVSFSIEQGEIVGLLGHNGAGKTTIMKMITGYLESDSGEVLLDGQSLLGHRQWVQSQLGYLPESLPLYADMTVVDYLDYAANLKQLGNDHKWKQIRRAITSTDIADKIHQRIGTLSRGYKQRVGVAQALLGNPQLLILDEPTNGLDPQQTAQMRELIRDLAKHATVILSTHIMQEVDALCSRVLMMKQGRLVVDESLLQLRSQNGLILEGQLDNACRTALAAFEGVEQLSILDSSPGWSRLRLRLQAVPTAATTTALIRLALDHGASLQRIQPEQRDLEGLFNEVNQDNLAAFAAHGSEEVNHAA
ncbi:ABC transporter ATP-binding protein [Oceanobacter mangrovi]|uniref:ABC transporter ATP-binding protein n=1 Tax=Oceanobacter mangrovi TaxID=2862510 RepID=UPI001C8D5E64|nr:ABC transporter ATP-binding protein [Oceanobacter mangrovi]